jgi:hypothetical protein
VAVISGVCPAFYNDKTAKLPFDADTYLTLVSNALNQAIGNVTSKQLTVFQNSLLSMYSYSFDYSSTLLSMFS